MKVKSPIKVHVAVNGAIVDASGRVLLTRRSAHIREPGKWCLPGGHLDPAETWQQALRREMAEELGVVVEAEQLVGLYSDPAVSITEEPLWDGHYGHYVVALFLITRWSGAITPNDEVDAWDYFPPDALPTLIVRSHPVRIADLSVFRGEVFIK